MKLGIIAGTVLMLAASFGFAGEAPGETKSFPAGKLSGITINAGNGFIGVESAAVNSIEVEQLPGNAERYEVTLEVAGKELMLKVRSKEHKEGHTGFQWNPPHGFLGGFRIRMPASLALKADMRGGVLEISGLSGPVDIVKDSGVTVLDAVSGDLTIKSKSGIIRGSVQSRKIGISGGGLVKLDGLTGALMLNNKSGPVDLRWAFVPKTGTIDIKSGTGVVSLTFPANARITPDLHAVSGYVRNDFPGGAGGRIVSATVEHGSISVLKAIE